MKKILVTGGAGFIGTHLCARLLEDGHHVICLDNYFSGREQNIAHLQPHSQFQAINHDITQPFDMDVDEIYNLACPASPVYYQHDPVKTVTTNVMGAIHALQLADKYNAKILQASTSEVYGDPTCHPQPEEYNGNVSPIGPRACYDEGKRCAETLFFDYHREKNVRIKVIRIFNTYGPHMRPDDGRVISNFIVQALKGQPITIYGDGSQTRSFCYVDDLVTGLIAMMETDDTITGPINLGNPGEFTIKALAELVTHHICPSQETAIEYHPLPQDDPVQRKPNIAKAQELLGWSPTIPLEEGLVKTIEYFQSHLAENHEKVLSAI